MFKQAKALFFRYQGNTFYMGLDYLYTTFKNYQVPQTVLAEWYQELLLKNKEQLLSAPNNREKVTKFLDYLELIRCNKQYFSYDDVKFAFNYFRENENLDDISKIIIIEIVIKFLQDQTTINPIIKQQCREVLNQINIDSYTIDDSYKYEGEFPSFTLKERVSQRILDDLEDLNKL